MSWLCHWDVFVFEKESKLDSFFRLNKNIPYSIILTTVSLIHHNAFYSSFFSFTIYQKGKKIKRRISRRREGEKQKKDVVVVAWRRRMWWRRRCMRTRGGGG